MAGRTPPPRRWDPGLRRIRRNLKGMQSRPTRKGEQDQVMIHPHAEKIQAPKPNMGAQSEANTVIGHLKPGKVDRDT
jgi:hypothetical protein